MTRKTRRVRLLSALSVSFIALASGLAGAADLRGEQAR
jgi:hypothetical protein